MKLLLCLLFVVAVTGVIESRFEWTRVRDATPTDDVTFTFLLRQKNLDMLKTMVLDRSDPLSPRFSQWLSREQIMDIVSPSVTERLRLIEQLRLRNISLIEDRGDNLVVKGKVGVVETLLRTQIAVWRHQISGRELFKCDEYSVPSFLRPTVEFVGGLAELPIKPRSGPSRKLRKQLKKTLRSFPAARSPQTGNWGSAIPAFLRSLYSIPTNLGNTSHASLCLVEFMDYSAFDKDATEQFNQQTAEPNWRVSHVVGPFGGDGLESALDVQYGGALARGANIWFWTGQRWLLDFAQEFFGTGTIPTVLSMSWGWPSTLQCSGSSPPGQCVGMNSRQYTERVETEFMKIAARGVTLVAASGDQGAPGDGFYDCSNGLSDIYPGASQWVTSLGATQLAQPGTVAENKNLANPWNAPICAPTSGYKCADGSNKYEVVCSLANNALITSGGGTAAYFPQPSWQSGPVQEYWKSGVTLPPARYYNQSARAFPDVSALGHSYLIWAPTPTDVDGTSCSTPVFAAMVTLLNAQRLQRGKKPLGHIAPLLYRAYAADKSIFIDITSGSNVCTEYCCSQYGFVATKGWDATTGLGSVNFSKLSAYVATLP